MQSPIIHSTRRASTDTKHERTPICIYYLVQCACSLLCCFRAGCLGKHRPSSALGLRGSTEQVNTKHAEWYYRLIFFTHLVLSQLFTAVAIATAVHRGTVSVKLVPASYTACTSACAGNLERKDRRAVVGVSSAALAPVICQVEHSAR